jgi:hypothetical protein
MPFASPSVVGTKPKRREHFSDKHTGIFGQVLLCGVLIFLYTPIFKIGDYNATVGGMCAAAVVLFAVIINLRHLRYLLYLAICLFYPLLIYGLHLLLQTRYAISSDRFLLSYFLWASSTGVIWASFQKRSFSIETFVLPALIGLSVLGAVQALGVKYFGVWFGYQLVRPIISFDIFRSYLNLQALEGPRAIGTYYEPSMFGRVIATLVTMYLFEAKLGRKGLFLMAALLMLNIYTTKSFGLVVLGTLSFIAVINRQRRSNFSHRDSSSSLLVIGAGLVGGLFFGSFIFERILEMSEAGYGSSYMRVTLPLSVLYDTIIGYPFGVPIGASSAVVTYAALPLYSISGESKITSGLYEIVLLFGVIGLAGILCVLGVGARYLWQRKSEKFLVAFYLVLSTAVSSSFLSIESSLLLYFLFQRLLNQCPNVVASGPTKCALYAYRQRIVLDFRLTSGRSCRDERRRP